MFKSTHFLVFVISAMITNTNILRHYKNYDVENRQCISEL